MSRVVSKKMHVCFVLPVPLLPLKGASFTCFNQAVVLGNLGYKVTILTSKPTGLSGNDPYSRLSLRGIKVVDSLPSKAGSGLSSHFYPLLFSWPHIWATLKKEKPDIVHVHNPTDIIPMVVAIVNTFYKVPYIFQLNDPGPESIVSIIGLKRTKRLVLYKIAQFMEYIIMAHASGFIAINEVLKRKIQESRKHLSGKPFIRQYHISSLKCDSGPLNDLQNESYVVYVGTLSTGFLGLENLIRSFAPIWHKYRTKLIVIGDGPLKRILEEAVDSAQAQDYVRLLGYLDPKDIPVYLKHARLCVIPYLDTMLTRVATPLKLFEYISMGKAVVCPDFEGFTEVIGKQNPGLYESSVDGDIVRVIDKLMGDPGLRSKAEDMNKQVSVNFDLSKEMAKMTDLYESLCHKTRNNKN